MNKFLFPLFGVMISISLNAQCPLGPEVLLSTQAEVDAFGNDYPACQHLPSGVDLIIMGADIQDLSPLSALQTVQGVVEIRDNPVLTTLAGFSVSYAGSDFILRDNPLLSDIGTFGGLDTIMGEFTIRSNPQLSSIAGFADLKVVGLDAIIRDNALLQNLNGLEQLQWVGGLLEILENPQLNDISSLSNLNYMGGGPEGALVIDLNPQLASLNGLGNGSTQINGDLTLSNNNQLSDCDEISICNYLSNPPAGAIITINLNATGCNSQTEIETFCTINGWNENENESFVSIFPNPAKTFITIRSNNPDAEFRILDLSGKLISNGKMLKQDFTIDLSRFEKGIYILQLSNKDKKSYHRFVVG